MQGLSVSSGPVDHDALLVYDRAVSGPLWARRVDRRGASTEGLNRHRDEEAAMLYLIMSIELGAIVDAGEVDCF
jgi:hypothetical protein